MVEKVKLEIEQENSESNFGVVDGEESYVEIDAVPETVKKLKPRAEQQENVVSLQEPLK